MPPRHRPTSDDATVRPAFAAIRQLPLPWPFSENGAAGVSVPRHQTVVVFSIGHSNHDAETLLALLAQHAIGTVVDVRSAPYSRYVPHFNRRELTRLMEDAGIEYVWAGDLLGGRPGDPACYGEDRVLDTGFVSRQPWYRAGVALLLAHAAAAPAAMLCSEEDPRRCHRHRLIEPSLREHGAIVLHIRRDGTLESIGPVSAEEPVAEQLVLAEFAP